MNTEQAWLWLTNIKNIGIRKRNLLIGYFDSPLDIYNAEEKDLRMIMGLSNSDIYSILKSKEIFDVRKYENYLEENEIKYVSIQNKKYPSLLKSIFDPPQVIYYKGELPKREDNLLGVVGSRHCTDYGYKMAYNLSKELAMRGVTIVSGMAIGIDTYAHKGALDGKGKTIAVLGCGVDICYPRRNKDLMKEIINNGAVISEYHPKTEPLLNLFPPRNRIISGLSKGILVVEAAERSGSQITVDQALEQGRDIFAVPGNINSELSKGTNNLIKQGAYITTSYKDIFEALGIKENNIVIPSHSTQEIKTEKNNFNKLLDEDEKIVYSCIDFKGSHIDDILAASKLGIGKLQHILTMLELNGVIKQLPGKIFERLM